MVGRTAEAGVVNAFLGAVSSGARALVIEGEPGIGKSSLFEAGLQASSSQTVTLVARPVQTEAKLTHSGLADLLDPIVDRLLPELPPPQRRALETALFRIEDKQNLHPQALSVAVLNLLRLQAERGPILIAIEDIQWFDLGSERVIAFALRRLGTEPIAFMATLRLGAMPGGLPIVAGIPIERCQRLRLGPLRMADLGVILQQDLSEPLPRATLLRIHESSGGNPYYSLQLLSALRSTGLNLAPGQPLPLPETLDALLMSRLDRLAEPTRAVTLAAAVLARPTEEAVVAIAGGSAAAQQGIGRAITAKILARDGERLRFTHPLLASTAYARADPEGRRQVHARAATVVTNEEESARHLALATDKPDEEVASALEAAARSARSHGAPHSAAELAELALMLTPADRPTDRLRRVIAAGTCYLDGGDTERASGLLQAAVARSVPGPGRAEARRQLALATSLSQNWRVTVELLTEAAAESEANSHLRAQIMLDLSVASVVLGDLPGSLKHSQDALQMVNQIDAADLRPMAQAAAAGSSFFLGRGLNEHLIQEAVEASEPGQQASHFTPRVIAGSIYKFADQFVRARALFEEELQAFRAHGDERGLPIVLYHLAELECWSGNYELADTYATEAEELVSLAGQRTHRVISLYASALVAAHRGRREEALGKAQESVELATRVGNVAVMQQAMSVLGFTELASGNPAAADAHLGPLAESVSAIGLGEPGVVRFLPDAIEALIVLGQLDKARPLLETFEDRARTLERLWALATSARCRGLLLAAEGNLDAALAALDEALSWHDQLELPLELGRTLLVKGEVDRRARRWRVARQTLARALAIFTALGAATWSERAQKSLARLGGRPSRSGELTPSERQTAALVAAGLSNKQIAERLFISVNTVQTTLKHVFRKTGVSSRAQLVAALGHSLPEHKDH